MGRNKKKASVSSSGGAQRRRRNRMETPSGSERFHGVQSLTQRIRRRIRTRNSTQENTRRSLDRLQQHERIPRLRGIWDYETDGQELVDFLHSLTHPRIRPEDLNLLHSNGGERDDEVVHEIIMIDFDDPSQPTDPDVEIIESLTVMHIPNGRRQRPARAMTTDNRSGNVVSFQKNGINYKFSTYSKGLLEFKVDGVTIRANYVTKQLENMKTKQPVINMVLESLPLRMSYGIHPTLKIHSYKSTKSPRFQVEVIGDKVGVFGTPPSKFMFGEASVTKVRPDIPIQRGGSQGCQICFVNRINVIFNCGHGTCTTCSRRLEKTICPFCSQKIKQKIPLFIDVRPLFVK